MGEPLPDTSPGISASQAAGILLKRPENRSEEEMRTLRRLKTVHRVTERCCSLFEGFAGMLRDKELRDKDLRDKEQALRSLEDWTELAKSLRG